MSPKYTDPESLEESITRSAFRKMGKQKQIDVMKRWFRERYEDPAHSTPYCSEEGGYIYINGGPFDAREELEDEFGDRAKDGTIESLATELESECWDWTHTDWYDQILWPRDDDFYEIEASLSNATPINTLISSLNSMTELLAAKDATEPHLHRFQLMMIFSFCITTLEAYLGHVFTTAVLGSEDSKIKYLRSGGRMDGFKKTAAQIYEHRNNVAGLVEAIDTHVKRTLQETTFHNIEQVTKLYKIVLGQDIDLTPFDAAIKKRHDFVHRGGRDNSGTDVPIMKPEAEELVEKIRAFCVNLDHSMNEPVF